MSKIELKSKKMCSPLTEEIAKEEMKKKSKKKKSKIKTKR